MSSTAANVRVTFMIPPGSYDYAKLVYKANAIPVSYSDGTAIDVLPSETEHMVYDLVEGVTYYFVIFTSKAQSTPVSYKASSIITLPAERIIVAQLVDEEFVDIDDWIYRWDIEESTSVNEYGLVVETTSNIVTEIQSYDMKESVDRYETNFTQESVDYEQVIEEE